MLFYYWPECHECGDSKGLTVTGRKEATPNRANILLGREAFYTYIEKGPLIHISKSIRRK